MEDFENINTNSRSKMKIKELDFITPPELSKLRGDAELEIDDFIDNGKSRAN